MANQLPQEVVTQIRELCSVSLDESAAFITITRAFVEQFIACDNAHDKIHVFQKITLFLSLTPHDWTTYTKFVTIVKAKLREFAEHLHVHSPEHIPTIWEMVEQVNYRCGTPTCVAMTVRGGRCKRHVGNQTTFFTRYCTQHRKPIEAKFAMVILAINSELIPDVLWVIARIAVDERLQAVMPVEA